MSVLEKDIEGKVCTWARKKNFLPIKVRFQDAGYPDRLFISPSGHTIFIEFKKPGEHPNPLQFYRLRSLQQRNIPAYWTDNYVEAVRILERALEPEIVPEESGKTPVVAGVRGAISRPGVGENLGVLSRFENSERERDDPEGPDYSACESDL